jgi:hypothetical protein
MNDLLCSPRYLIRTARGETSPAAASLDTALNECPEGYRLHSVVPVASGSGYTASLTVIFEREPALAPGAALSADKMAKKK